MRPITTCPTNQTPPSAHHASSVFTDITTDYALGEVAVGLATAKSGSRKVLPTGATGADGHGGRRGSRGKGPPLAAVLESKQYVGRSLFGMLVGGAFMGSSHGWKSGMQHSNVQ